MLEEIDIEMERRGIQGLVVLGDTTLGNPDLTYVVGRNLARGGIYFKRAACKPLLITSILDVLTARGGRVENVRTFTDLGFEKLLVEHGQTEAYPRLILEVLTQLVWRER